MVNRKDEKSYAISEAINALLIALDKMGIEFILDSVLYAYDKDEGQFVFLRTEGFPDFEVSDEMLIISDFEWIVKSIKYVSGNKYETVFLLEDII